MNNRKKIVFLLAVAGWIVFSAGCAKNIVPSPTPSEINHFPGIYEDELLRNAEGINLFARYWAPDQNIRAIVLVLHGTSFHGGVYEEIGKYLAAHGYMVYAPDLRGWGQTAGKGARGYIDSYDEYVSDLALIMERLKKEYPQKNIYALGESLGATVAMYGYLKGDLPFDGMIFSGPGYKPNPKILGIRLPRMFFIPSQYMLQGWGEIFPHWPLGWIDFGIMMAVRNDEAQDRLLDDPFVAHNWLPASYATGLFKADRYNIKHIESLDIPLFISHGEDDMLVPVSSSKEIYKRVGTQDKTLHVYPDTPHATLIEATRYDVFRDILHWLNAHEQVAKKSCPEGKNTAKDNAEKKPDKTPVTVETKGTAEKE